MTLRYEPNDDASRGPGHDANKRDHDVWRHSFTVVSLSEADVEYIRQTAFSPGVLTHPYHSPNTAVTKRIRYIET